MSDETKKDESVAEEKDAQSELSDAQLNEAAGGSVSSYAKVDGIPGPAKERESDDDSDGSTQATTR